MVQTGFWPAFPAGHVDLLNQATTALIPAAHWSMEVIW